MTWKWADFSTQQREEVGQSLHFVSSLRGLHQKKASQRGIVLQLSSRCRTEENHGQP
jgi:hypothetical protein